MRAIMIIFTVILGTTILSLSSMKIKKEAIIKVHKGLSPLEVYTKKLTR
jgi:hypothetical protein